MVITLNELSIYSILYICKGGCVYYLTSIIVHISVSILWLMVPVSELQRPNSQFFLLWSCVTSLPLVAYDYPAPPSSYTCAPFVVLPSIFLPHLIIFKVSRCPKGISLWAVISRRWVAVWVFWFFLTFCSCVNANISLYRYLGHYRLLWAWNPAWLQSGLQHKESRWWEPRVL